MLPAEGGSFDMTFDVLSSLAVYALVTGWSPGPNNVLLLSTTGQFGLKRSMKLITGIWTGFLTIMLLCAVFSVGLGKLLPGVVPYLKYIGAAYILYLAFTVLKRKLCRQMTAQEKRLLLPLVFCCSYQCKSYPVRHLCSEQLCPAL